MDYLSKDIAWACAPKATTKPSLEPALELKAKVDMEGVKESKNNAVSEQQSEENDIAASEPEKEAVNMLEVGTRVEGNYYGSGQWYKGW